LTGTGALRNVPAMSKSSLHAVRRGLLALLLLGLGPALSASAATAAKPYVEKAPARGFHLFGRPKQKGPEAQWEYVLKLERAGKLRATANQALALRLFWPHSAQAPEAQLLLARTLERRGHLLAAFDAYQHLLEHYSGRFEFNEVLDRQRQIAKTVMDKKKGKFLFLPGFAAPERAIPLYEKIVASAPEGRDTAELYYLIGVANERIYEYDKAIEAYFTALNRFPGKPRTVVVKSTVPVGTTLKVRDRIRAAGFALEDFTAVEPLVSRHGLSRGGKIFVCRPI